MHSYHLKLVMVLALSLAAKASVAKTILVIGDSHSCGSFGQRMVEDLSQLNNSVDLYCAVSSSASNWALGKNPKGQACSFRSTQSAPVLCSGNGQVPKLSWILGSRDYDEVVIALGTNSLGSSIVDSSHRELVQIVGAKQIPCFWIAPPHLRPDQAKGFSANSLSMMNANLSKFYLALTHAVGAQCSVIDSRPITQPGQAGGETVDGVHRTLGSGRAWADAVVGPAN